MAISFACTSCGGKLKVADGAAGRLTSCPHCKTSVTVPGEKIDVHPASPSPAATATAGASTPAAASIAAGAAKQPQVACSACGAMNPETAKKCRHCGEVLDPKLRREQKLSQQAIKLSGQQSDAKQADGSSQPAMQFTSQQSDASHGETKGRSRHKRKAPEGPAGVQLSLIITPMLDMSFQILAFFIMTYHPSALEGHIPGSLVPPDNFAKKSKDNNPLPAEAPPLSIPEEDLIPELQEAITVKIKAVTGREPGVGSRVEGMPSQIFIKTGLEADYRAPIADVDIEWDRALDNLSKELKGMLKKGTTNKAHLKIAADGDLRQQYVMAVYDTAKKAGFDKIHFVPPPVLNTKIK